MQPDINRLAKEFKVKTYDQHHEGRKIVDLEGKVHYYSGEIPMTLGNITGTPAYALLTPHRPVCFDRLANDNVARK